MGDGVRPLLDSLSDASASKAACCLVVKLSWTLDDVGELREVSRSRYCWFGGDCGTASSVCVVRMH